MAITPLPTLDRTLPTFKADTDKFFGQQLPQFSIDLNTLADSVDSANTAATASKNAAASSATAAANSATAANTSKNAAATSATNAATSESNANSSKNAAASSATAAATSATNAATSETNANASKNAAATSATNAATSETNANSSKTAAASSASAAATSATNAATSKTNADTAASNASSSATAAANSATAANTSKNAAATSATNAADSESNALSYKNAASNSATNAANSAAQAQAAADAATAGGVKSVNGKNPNSQGAVVLVAGDLGLGNVNNTADSAKPVSTAQAAAIAQKLSLTGGTVTGEVFFAQQNAFRLINGNYGTIFRQDGGAFYMLVTAINDQTGNFTSQRPFTLNLATGVASINGDASRSYSLVNSRKIGGTAFNGTADIGVNAQWIGNSTETMPTGTTAYSAADANLLVDGMYSATAKGYPINFGNRLQIRGYGLSVSEFLMEWATNGGDRLFYRSRGDVNTHTWSTPKELAYVNNVPDYVRNAVLAGLAVDVARPITASDTFLAAMGKLQAQATVSVEGFDSRRSWHFGSSTESWVATGASITQANGKATVTSSTADPYITSPANLQLPGSQYGKVRAAVTRVAGSGWDGTLYYVTSGHGIGTGYRKTLPNPNLAIGETAVLEWDMWNLTAGDTDWKSNTINQIRLDLGGSTTDVFDIEFIAIGRDGPQQQQILGSVGFDASNVAVGAIIERGSNANGEYVKFADGTMICTRQFTTISIAYGSVYGNLYYGTHAWTFPATFAAQPATNVVATVGGQIVWPSLLSVSTSQTQFYLLNGANQTASTTLLYTAIGRWF